MKIISINNILYNNKLCSINEIVDMADYILKKDNINDFKDMSINIKNNY
nr:MAG TPA: hypothetical protein [Caudoviricetes sp.]